MNKVVQYPGSLHCHTHFSNFRSLDAITTVESLIDRAMELGHMGVAITEHDTISSHLEAIEYVKKIKEKNPHFKLVLGNEIYLCRNGLNSNTFRSGIDHYYHFILLAKDEVGHRQIRELSTRAWTRSYMARGMRRVPTYYQDLYDIVKENPGHLIASSACLGSLLGVQLQKYKAAGEPEDLRNHLRQWIIEMEELFGKGNFYLELQPSHTTEQIYVNNQLLSFSKELDIPYIITTDTHYARAADRKIHKAFLTARFAERETDMFYASTYMMDTKEILSYMEKHIGTEAIYQAFLNIEEIMDRCEEYELAKPLKIPYLPQNPITPSAASVNEWKEKIPYLEEFLETDWESDVHLVGAILNKISQNEEYQNKEVYDGITSNLRSIRDTSIVTKAPWSAYLLGVKDYVDIAWTKGNSLVGVGRGSGGGFLLLHLLDIIQMNPLKENVPLYSWRFLNPERVSPLDIDLDMEGAKRTQIYAAMEETYGRDRVARVLTLRTEKAKSAILTAARGVGGVDVDEAQYLSSFVKSERGILHTLTQTFYGDPENGISPNKEFQRLMTEEYPDLWEVAQNIEGLINGAGIHASGVIVVDEPFYETTALMRTNSGDLVTQFDLGRAEEVGLIKADFLSIEALDKIRVTLDLLVEYGYVTPEPTLRETYEKVLGVYNITRDDPTMWEMLHRHEVLSFFQMEQQSGIQGIALAKPTSVEDLAAINSAIRLMSSGGGRESSLAKFARFKKDISGWYEEMDRYELSREEQEVLEPILKVTYGLCIAQEQFMQLVQLPEAGGHSLLWADRLRKAVGKKLPEEFEALEKEFYETAREQKLSMALINYIWRILIYPNRGYGFNLSHTLLYSLIGLQELNLAYHYPIIFWNTANLIVDSGGAQVPFEIEEEIEAEELYTDSPSFFEEEEGEEEDEDEVAKKKTKTPNRTTDYGKIATAIGKFQNQGIEILPPDINRSGFTFTPDVEKNIINFGLSGITRVGDDIIENILRERPFESFDDFLKRIKLNRLQAINLIKAGAFEIFEERTKTLKKYIYELSSPKKRITLQNMARLIELELLPETLAHEVKVYNFNKYLRKNKLPNDYFGLDEIALKFYEEHFNMDLLKVGSTPQYALMIAKSTWEPIYQKFMNKVRPFVQKNQESLLSAVNKAAYNELWDKYCTGTMSRWEMDAISHYQHDHELSHVDHAAYGVSAFNDLPEDPEVDYFFYKNNRSIPVYKIQRIIGTVLDRDKTKNLVTVLTVDGVAQVKIYGDAFSKYDKQLSAVDPSTGRKKVVEKSWFSRGNLIVVTGIRRRELFMAKKYAKTPFHLVEKITDVSSDGKLTTIEEREVW